MKQLLSVWLVPQKNDEEYLGSIIKNLAQKNDAPVFIPHLTLFGDIEIELKDLKHAIDKVFEKIKPFSIKKTTVSQSELFFKTVFVEFEKSMILINLFQDLSKETLEKSVEEFKPHISLIYKTMSKEEKMKIIDNLNIKNDFVIDRVVINAPKIGEKDFLNVLGWQSIYEKRLNY